MAVLKQKFEGTESIAMKLWNPHCSRYGSYEKRSFRLGSNVEFHLSQT